MGHRHGRDKLPGAMPRRIDEVNRVEEDMRYSAKRLMQCPGRNELTPAIAEIAAQSAPWRTVYG